MNQTDTINQLKIAISNDIITLENSIITIYKKQTEIEKQSKDTKENNGVGFNGMDATILSKCAEYILSGKHLTGWYLTTAIKRMPKYAKQLLTIRMSEV
jgi:hypothetical protein